MNPSFYNLDRLTKYFLVILSVIAVFGAIMVYSSSYIFAKEIYANSAYFFNKQVAMLFLGCVGAFVISKTKINFWLKYSDYLQMSIFFLVLLTFVPGLGYSVKGANRWVNLGFIGIQPGEFIKFTTILIAIPLFEKFEMLSKKEKIKKTLLILLPLTFLLIQPDFGTFSICLLVTSFVAFLSKFSRKKLYYGLVLAVVTVIPILISQPYRVRRLFAFLDPWKNPQTSGFQIIQSYLAFANGSWFGLGIGNSNEKLFYLPEAHNDFIFSVVGEELGFMGVMIVVALFFSFISFGFAIAMKATSRINFMVGSTVVFTIGMQAMLNMGVVLGLLPTKGLNLPFISAGGSSLLANFFAIGLMLSMINSEKRKNNLLGSLEAGNDFSNFDTPKQESMFPRNPSRLP